MPAERPRLRQTEDAAGPEQHLGRMAVAEGPHQPGAGRQAAQEVAAAPSQRLQDGVRRAQAQSRVRWVAELRLAKAQRPADARQASPASLRQVLRRRVQAGRPAAVLGEPSVRQASPLAWRQACRRRPVQAPGARRASLPHLAAVAEWHPRGPAACLGASLACQSGQGAGLLRPLAAPVGCRPHRLAVLADYLLRRLGALVGCRLLAVHLEGAEDLLLPQTAAGLEEQRVAELQACPAAAGEAARCQVLGLVAHLAQPECRQQVACLAQPECRQQVARLAALASAGALRAAQLASAVAHLAEQCRLAAGPAAAPAQARDEAALAQACLAGGSRAAPGRVAAGSLVGREQEAVGTPAAQEQGAGLQSACQLDVQPLRAYLEGEEHLSQAWQVDFAALLSAVDEAAQAGELAALPGQRLERRPDAVQQEFRPERQPAPGPDRHPVAQALVLRRSAPLGAVQQQACPAQRDAVAQWQQDEAHRLAPSRVKAQADCWQRRQGLLRPVTEPAVTPQTPPDLQLERQISGPVCACAPANGRRGATGAPGERLARRGLQCA